MSKKLNTCFVLKNGILVLGLCEARSSVSLIPLKPFPWGFTKHKDLLRFIFSVPWYQEKREKKE